MLTFDFSMTVVLNFSVDPNIVKISCMTSEWKGEPLSEQSNSGTKLPQTNRQSPQPPLMQWYLSLVSEHSARTHGIPAACSLAESELAKLASGPGSHTTRSRAAVSVVGLLSGSRENHGS